MEPDTSSFDECVSLFFSSSFFFFFFFFFFPSFFLLLLIVSRVRSELVFGWLRYIFIDFDLFHVFVFLLVFFFVFTVLGFFFASCFFFYLFCVSRLLHRFFGTTNLISSALFFFSKYLSCSMVPRFVAYSTSLFDPGLLGSLSKKKSE